MNALTLPLRQFFDTALRGFFCRVTKRIRVAIGSFFAVQAVASSARYMRTLSMGMVGIALFCMACVLGQVVSDDGRELLLLLAKKAIFDVHALCTVCTIAVSVLHIMQTQTVALIVAVSPLIAGLLALAIPIAGSCGITRMMQRHHTTEQRIRLSIYRLVHDQFCECVHCAHKNLCPMSSLELMNKMHSLCRERGVDLTNWQQEARRHFRKHPDDLQYAATAPTTATKKAVAA